MESKEWADIAEDSEEEMIEPQPKLDEYDWEHLPEHACYYCGNHDPQTVAKCTTDDCNRWFCNSYGENRAGSHIIVHLVKARHRSVSMHPENSLGDTEIECFICKNRNIFILGLVPSRLESTLIFLCRQPCAVNNVLSEKEWDLGAWQSLIEEKRFLTWILNEPTRAEDEKARKLSIKEIAQIEELILHGNPSEVPKPAAEEFVKSVQTEYKDVKEYFKIYKRLVELEAEYDREVKSSQKKTGIKVNWERGQRGDYQGKFVFPLEDSSVRMAQGTEMDIKYEFSNWTGRGTVVTITEEEEVVLSLTHFDSSPPKSATSYTISLVWKPTPFRRMQNGLVRFNRGEIDAYLAQKILGHDVSMPYLARKMTENLHVPNLPLLNTYQQAAVKKALQSRLLLIQGPPGTGKTVTTASIVYHLVKETKEQVLVTAPSNIAVDQLTEKIHRCGIKVVRLCAKSREAVSSSVDFLTLHNMIRNLDTPEYKDLKRLISRKDAGEHLPDDEHRKLEDLIKKAENELLAKAEVICCTCSMAFDPKLRNFLFKRVLIDEATQATEPECLLPILTGAEQVILVGDHCQLGPVVMCKKAVAAGFNTSLFERLVALKNVPVRLHIQYRMHPTISEFPSNMFYEGTLQNGVSINERTYQGLDFPWPIPNKPIFFYNTIGPEELSSTGTSYVNRTEASNLEKIVSVLISRGLSASQIGIITPYEGQRAYITSYMHNLGTLSSSLYQGIEISSVDSFQGREKDFIILSCVRSNDNLGIGFLNDPRRLNVALTRAKFGVVICGNARVLSKDRLWNNLLNYYKDLNVLVEGPLNNLKQCLIHLSPPEPIKQPSSGTAPDSLNFLGAFASLEPQDFLSNL